MMDMSVIPGLLELSMMDDGLLGGVTAIQPVFAGGQIVNGNKLADLGARGEPLPDAPIRG